MIRGSKEEREEGERGGAYIENGAAFNIPARCLYYHPLLRLTELDTSMFPRNSLCRDTCNLALLVSESMQSACQPPPPRRKEKRRPAPKVS